MMTNTVPSNLLSVHNNQIQMVHSYIYLEHEVRIDRDNQTAELLRKITLRWAAYDKLPDAFKSDILIKLKREALTMCVLPILTYGAETLTLIKASAPNLQKCNA